MTQSATSPYLNKPLRSLAQVKATAIAKISVNAGFDPFLHFNVVDKRFDETSESDVMAEKAVALKVRDDV